MKLIIVAVVMVCVFACLCQGMPNRMAKGHIDGGTTDTGQENSEETRYGLMKKLKGYRYIKKYVGIEGGKTGPSRTLEESLIDLQRMSGLQETGEIDEPTARLMTWPRCGLPDQGLINLSEEGERKKRYIVAGETLKWNKMDLTFKIENFPNATISVITNDDVVKAVKAAFKLWSDVTPLTFTRIEDDNTQADINMLFGNMTHTSVFGDPIFDGPGGTLAHAFTPSSGWGKLNGDVHYDDEESFTHKKYFGRNLQYITAHEVGHALGLDHSDVYGSLMWPWIVGYIPNYQLPEDDRLGIQSIYGENPNPPTDTTTVAPTTTPQAQAGPYCNITFDDVDIIRGELFAFKKKVFWRFSLDGHLISDVEGSPIRGFFKKVPATVNGIFERWYDEKVIFVKGKNYWQLEGVVADDGYPIPLSDMGIPRGIDGAMHRASTGITYFFKDKLAYEYDEYESTLLSNTPQKIHRIFNGIPRGTILTGSFTGTDGYGYLLSGENYYTVNANLESDGVIRQFAQDFLRCPQ